MSIHQRSEPPPTLTNGDDVPLGEQLEALAARVRQPVPARAGARRPAAGARHALDRRDAADRRGARPRRDPGAQPGDVRDDVDGARGAADDRREPASQLHRPRRVSADGGDRAALHPHARGPLPRAGRDHRRAHAGIVGGDHARRAVAEVEVARRGASRPARTRRARTSSSAATCTSCGRSSAATSTSSRGSSRCSATSTRSGPRTSSPTSTRTRSASPPCSGPRSRATPTTSAASTTCWSACKHEQGPRRPAARRRGERRLRLAVPVPGLRVGLPARAGALDQRLGPQVRPRLPGHRLARVPRDAATSPRTSSSTRTTSASATRRSR